MAKTPEELRELKEKIKAIKGEIGELSREEIDQITGGDDETDCDHPTPTCPKCKSQLVYFDYYYNVYVCRRCGHQWKM